MPDQKKRKMVVVKFSGLTETIETPGDNATVGADGTLTLYHEGKPTHLIARGTWTFVRFEER